MVTACAIELRGDEPPAQPPMAVSQRLFGMAIVLNVREPEAAVEEGVWVGATLQAQSRWRV